MIFEEMADEDLILQIDEIPEVYYPLFSDIDTNRNKELDYDEVFNAFLKHDIHIVGASTDPHPHIDPVIVDPVVIDPVPKVPDDIPSTISFDVNLSDGTETQTISVAISNIALE